MKLALLSDIHSNIHGFEACLEHARVQSVDQIALLGDYVGYGADPVAVLELAIQLAGRGAWLIKGNHDAMAVNPPLVPRTLGDSTAAWTHAQLSASHRAFLQKLPMLRQADSVLLVHASPESPDAWNYVYEENSACDGLDVAAEIRGVHQVFVGHVHMQTLYERNPAGLVQKVEIKPGIAYQLPPPGHWLATIGSCGQPRDGDVRAMYAIFDTVLQQITWYRVDYDYLDAASAIRRVGLPHWLAQRLEMGR